MTAEDQGADQRKATVTARLCGPVNLGKKLRSLRDGDSAFIDAVLMGRAAIPVLREVLFESDPGGIFEPQRRAIQALAMLKATNVLKEFIRGWKPSSDPVERFGNEAVLSSAARALGATLEDEAYQILRAIAQRYPVPGVIESIGYFRRAESIPILVRALADDLGRSPAEQAIRIFGRAAVPLLIHAVSNPISKFRGRESPSSIRRYRSILRLILELGSPEGLWDRVRNLACDSDDEISMLVCKIGLVAAGDTERHECASRLVTLLSRVAWPLNQEIEESLVGNVEIAHKIVDRILNGSMNHLPKDLERVRFKRSLQRLKARWSLRSDVLS
jgi:hypothetical protein